MSAFDRVRNPPRNPSPPQCPPRADKDSRTKPVYKCKLKDKSKAVEGGERIPRTCWPPTDDEPLRYEFGAPTALLEFSADFSLDQRQTPWRKLILAAHPDSYKHHQCNLADHQISRAAPEVLRSRGRRRKSDQLFGMGNTGAGPRWLVLCHMGLY